MQEVFCEESSFVEHDSNRDLKYKILTIVIINLYIFAFISFILAFYGFPITTLIFTAIFVGVAIYLGIRKNNLYVDYDYTFVTGSVRFSKVINNKKRKSICKFEASDIERIGRYNSETFLLYQSMEKCNYLVLTSNIDDSDKEFYYIVANFEGEKHLIVLECTQNFIINVLKFASRSVLEKGFVNK
jgi:hypothetical protein